MRSHSLFGFALAFTACTTCLAGFTKIGNAPAAEATQGAIIGALYGGTFHQIGEDFFNGTISLRRVADRMNVAQAMNMSADTIGDATDECWMRAKFTARPVAKFSNNSQTLSINDRGTRRGLFDVTGYGYDINSASASASCFGETMSFERSGNSGTQSSFVDENSDGRDHMISYEVLGLGGKAKTWLMFWEDLDLTPDMPRRRTSSDFNDLVVEVRATAVPVPAALWAGGSLLAATGVFRKRLRKVAGV